MSDVFATLSESFALSDGSTSSTPHVDEQITLVDNPQVALSEVLEEHTLDFTFITPIPAPLIVDETLVDAWEINTDYGLLVNAFVASSIFTGELAVKILGSCSNTLVLDATLAAYVEDAIPLTETFQLTDFMLGYLLVSTQQNTYSPIGA